jgi:hypothetical protein
VIRREDVDAPMVCNRDRAPSFANVTCTRPLCQDGTLWEVVGLDKIAEGGEQPTNAELNTWIVGFSIEPLTTSSNYLEDH